MAVKDAVMVEPVILPFLSQKILTAS